MALLAAMVAARAEEPTVNLQNHFVALQVLLGDLGNDIAAARTLVMTERAAVADADARLKWVLDNWVPKPDGVKQ
ncbi:MAG: hypothetical protein V4502_11150 [Pseudomonadota bacterium]